jgi:ATP adenylyltransferase
VLVATYAHEPDLDAIPEAAAFELMAATRRIIRALRAAYHPEGFNVGANLGAAAGAGFGEHVHLHVVPRWSGDTNFMTTVGRSRVIPENLEDTAARLRAALEDDL